MKRHLINTYSNAQLDKPIKDNETYFLKLWYVIIYFLITHVKFLFALKFQIITSRFGTIAIIFLHWNYFSCYNNFLNNYRISLWIHNYHSGYWIPQGWKWLTNTLECTLKFHPTPPLSLSMVYHIQQCV